MTGFIIPSNSRYLLGLLNSNLFKYFIENTAISRRGGYNEFKTQYILQFPLKKASENIQRQISDHSELLLNKYETLKNLNQRFQKLILSEFEIAKFSQKLNKWWEHDFEELSKILPKSVTLKQKQELLDLFEINKEQAISLISEIHSIERKINIVVYDLYGLNESEIKVIEK